MKGRSWKNVPGSINTSLLLEDIEDELKLLLVGHLCKACGDIPKLDPEDEMEEVGFEIGFTSSGYEDPGRLSPPEDCYPPDSEDERVMSFIIFRTKNCDIELDEYTADKVFERFCEEIDDAELEERY